jgi:hypothetical protein
MQDLIESSVSLSSFFFFSPKKHVQALGWWLPYSVMPVHLLTCSTLLCLPFLQVVSQVALQSPPHHNPMLEQVTKAICCSLSHFLILSLFLFAFRVADFVFFAFRLVLVVGQLNTAVRDGLHRLAGHTAAGMAFWSKNERKADPLRLSLTPLPPFSFFPCCLVLQAFTGNFG